MFNSILYKFQEEEKITKFTNVDSENLYNYNLSKLGNDWHYANKEIIYEFNSLGYRTKELDYYKDKDFILVLGASDVIGIGLAEDEIWHHQLKKEFGYEILNASVAGSGPDIQMLNSMLFLKNSELRPKAVIIQWPDFDRFAFKGDNSFTFLLPGLFDTSNLYNNSNEFLENIKDIFFSSDLKTFYKEWIKENNSSNNSKIFIEVSRLLWKLSNIPYYDFRLEYFNDAPEFIDNYGDLVTDLARDQIHFGPKTHELIGIEVCKKIKNNIVF